MHFWIAAHVRELCSEAGTMNKLSQRNRNSPEESRSKPERCS
jgi:hypothetical protein